MSTPSSAAAWLQRLIDATPYPTSTDPEALLALWGEVVRARDSILAEGKVSIGPELAVVYGELVARQDQWGAALLAARENLGSQRMGAARVRHYQRLSGAADL